VTKFLVLPARLRDPLAMTKLFGLYGVGGFGRQVMPLAERQLSRVSLLDYELVFVDDGSCEKEINNKRVMAFSAFIGHPASEKNIALTIADGLTRESLFNKCQRHDLKPWSVVSSNIEVYDDVVIGEGAIIASFVLLTCNIKIGRFFQANHYSHVAHDCEIGDFVTFAPGVRCNGNVVVEDYAYIGTGAMLRQGTPQKPLVIGRNAVVGMGAVVTKDVPPDTTVVGNPARPISARKT